jgi:hypothetical protein
VLGVRVGIKGSIHAKNVLNTRLDRQTQRQAFPLALQQFHHDHTGATLADEDRSLDLVCPPLGLDQIGLFMDTVLVVSWLVGIAQAHKLHV